MEQRYKFITNPHKIDNYDSAILEDRAYLNMEDTSLKLEYQISLLEDNISILDEEIKGAKLIEDEEKIKLLSKKKLRMERQLKILMFKYTNIDFTAKIIAFISLIFKKRKNQNNTIGDYMLKHFWSKISKKMKTIYELKVALEKLGNINRSVDELISMQAPVKGAKDRYEKLTSYINKANTIHSEISNNIKSKTIYI